MLIKCKVILLCGVPGEAEAIFRRAEATARGLGQLSTAIRADGGGAAASMRIAEQYLAAFGNIAKTGQLEGSASTVTLIVVAPQSWPRMGGNACMRVAEQYLAAFGNIAETGVCLKCRLPQVW